MLTFIVNYYNRSTNKVYYLINVDSYVKNKVVAIYTKYDIMSLERIVGTRKAMEMVKEYCNNVSFIV